MTPTPRQSGIISAVNERGPQTIEALADMFDVTLQTVRRDVTRLADAGLLARFHGGVRMPESTTENIAYRKRQAIAAQEKRRIAQAVAQRVPNGCSLVMNVGTTIEAVAYELRNHTGLRVITNNLNVAALLSTNQSCEVIVAGGVVRASDQAITGEATVDFIRQFKVDIGLIGISGIEMDGTLRDYDYREVRVARTIIEQSRERFCWPPITQNSSEMQWSSLLSCGRLIGYLPIKRPHLTYEKSCNAMTWTASSPEQRYPL